MGLDSTFYLPKGVRRQNLEEFLSLLGYEKYSAPQYLRDLKATCFHYFSPRPYESLQGVTFTVAVEDGAIVAYGRNNIWRNRSDNDFHNYTLKHLRKRFRGYFISDYGKNRYFPYDGIHRENDESGCYIEAERALNQLKEINVILMARGVSQTPVQKGDMIWMNQMHPDVILGNLAVVHFLSTIENFFKNTYVALLTFSKRKSELMRASKIRDLDLVGVADGTMRVEQAFANGLNFQEVDAICRNFDQLDQSLAIRQELRKRHGRRKENFFSFMERIANHRHRFVHHAEKYIDYDLQSLKRDLAFCELLIHRIYKVTTHKKGWTYEKPF